MTPRSVLESNERWYGHYAVRTSEESNSDYAPPEKKIRKPEDGNSLVGDLKVVLKAKKVPEFDNFPADKFKLWKVEISGDHEDELLAINIIGDYWTENPPKKSIHVLIEPPVTSST
ncbi:hypothetical protein C1646_676027 [Rhizophagus diaphanus]|nr:hypothetical protein C1646_676027 [Rhizophagus diaphanus] [Rhizophagus sp. MUCL 43196]